jgi:hypothetical protein
MHEECQTDEVNEVSAKNRNLLLVLPIAGALLVLWALTSLRKKESWSQNPISAQLGSTYGKCFSHKGAE